MYCWIVYHIHLWIRSIQIQWNREENTTKHGKFHFEFYVSWIELFATIDCPSFETNIYDKYLSTTRGYIFTSFIRLLLNNGNCWIFFYRLENITILAQYTRFINSDSKNGNYKLTKKKKNNKLWISHSIHFEKTKVK